MGVSFAMYVSTLLIVFEKSRTEPVSPREWRTVASFMEKAGRVIGVSGGFELELVWMTTYFMNWVLSVGRNTKLVKWRELRKEWFRRRARMVLQSRHGLSRWERTAGECLGTASNCWGMGKLLPAAPPDSPSVDHTSITQPFVERQGTHQVHTDSMRESRGTDLLLPRVLGHCSRCQWVGICWHSLRTDTGSDRQTSYSGQSTTAQPRVSLSPPIFYCVSFHFHYEEKAGPCGSL